MEEEMFEENDANSMEIGPMEVADDGDDNSEKLQVVRLTSQTTDLSYWPVLFSLKSYFLSTITLFHVFENGKSTLLITGDDRVYVFGKNLKLFSDYSLNLDKPTEIKCLSGQEVSSISESEFCVVILCRDGTLFGWPRRQRASSLEPKACLRGIVKVKSVGKLMFALDFHGKLWFRDNHSAHHFQPYKRCQSEVVDFDVISLRLVVATKTDCIQIYQHSNKGFLEEQFNESIKCVASLVNSNLVLTHTGDLYQKISDKWNKCKLVSPIEVFVSNRHQIYLKFVDGSCHSFDPNNWQPIRISPSTISDAHYFYHPLSSTPMLTSLPPISTLNQQVSNASQYRLNDTSTSDLTLMIYHSRLENVERYKPIHVHRSIICQHSPMLRSKLKDGVHELLLDNYRFPVYYYYIHFLYSGHFDVRREWLFEFALMVGDCLEEEKIDQNHLKSLQRALSLEDLVELYRVSVNDNHVSDRRCHQVRVQQCLEEAILFRMTLKDIEALHRQLYFTPIAARFLSYFTDNYCPMSPLPRWQPEPGSNETQDIAYWPVLFYLEPTIMSSVSHFYVFSSTQTALVVTYQRLTYLVNEKQTIEVPQLRNHEVKKIVETKEYLMVLLKDGSLYAWKQVDTNNIFGKLNLLLSIKEVRDMVSDWQCTVVVNTTGRVRFWHDLNASPNGVPMTEIEQHEVVSLACARDHFFAITAQSLILIWDFGLNRPENILVMRFEGVRSLAPNVTASRCFALGSFGEIVRFKYEPTFNSVEHTKRLMLRECAQSLVTCGRQMYVQMYSGSFYVVIGHNGRKLIATSNRCAADAHYFWGQNGNTPQLTALSPELSNPLRIHQMTIFNNPKTCDLIILVNKPRRRRIQDRFKQRSGFKSLARRIYVHISVLKQSCNHYQQMLLKHNSYSTSKQRYFYADRMYHFGTHFAYLRYLYTSVVEVSVEFFPELYEMAREYGNVTLEHQLDQYGRQFSLDQWLDIYVFYSHKWYLRGQHTRQAIHRFLMPKVNEQNCLHVFERLFKVTCIDLMKLLYPIIHRYWPQLVDSSQFSAMRDVVRRSLVTQMENFPTLNVHSDISSDNSRDSR